MAADKPLVLLTGGNGNIGFRVLVFLLQGGYRVRAALRNTSRIELIHSAESIKAIAPSEKDLEFAIVPDLTVPGAYDEAVQGVDYVIHVGGPIAHNLQDPTKFKDDVIVPSVNGTLNMLASCEGSPSVKRVVLTSSVTAFMTATDFLFNEPPQVFTEKSRIEDQDEDAAFQMEWEAYVTAKVNSLNRSERWIRERKGKVHFDLVNVHPAICFGAHELATTKADLISGVNFILIMAVMGQQSPFPVAGTTVHLDDVAEVFVKALDKQKVPTDSDGLLSLMAHSEGERGTVYDDAFDTVRKTWPELVANGQLPCTGSQPTRHVKFDASATEKLLGMKFKGYDEQVKSLVGQWVKLVEKEGADMGDSWRIN